MKKLIILCVVLAVAAMSLPAQADYKATVLADNPLGLWEFEDAASNDGAACADSAAGGLSPGVYRNRTEGTPNDIPDVALVAGIVGQAAEFHGTWGSGYGNFVQIYDSLNSPIPYRLESSESLSLEFWEMADRTGSETYARFISHSGGWDTPSKNYWVGMTTTGENPGQPFVGVPNGTWYAWPPNILTDGGWHHVVVTYAFDDVNTTATLYIDAINQGTYVQPGAFMPPSDWEDLLIGAENDQNWVYNGLIGAMDEVAYYDYVLSPEQVSAHFQAIPEPVTIALLGLGGLALLRRKRA